MQMRTTAAWKRSLDTRAYSSFADVELDSQGDAAMPPSPSSSTDATSGGGGWKRPRQEEKVPTMRAEGATATVAAVSTPCTTSALQPSSPRSRETLEQDNQRLRADVDSMRAEIAHLRT